MQNDLEDDENDIHLSKTQIKNQMKSLQDLGEELVKLSDKDRATIPLPDFVDDAIQLALKINNKKEAYRRQLQYIGKLMREVEIVPIENALMVLKRKAQLDKNNFHQLETMRDELIANGDDAINALVDSHSQLDRQKLRQLIRNAAKEKSQNKPSKAYRELFKYLKEQITL